MIQEGVRCCGALLRGPFFSKFASCSACRRRARLLPRLNFDVNIDQRDRGGRDARNAAGLTESARTDARELLVHLARKAADLAVLEPVGNDALLRLLQPLDGLGLLVEVAGVLDFGFDGLELVANSSG